MQQAIRSMQQEGKPIESARMVCEAVRLAENLEVSEKQVRLALKKDFKLSFLRSKKLASAANSHRCLVLRQQFALRMLQLHSESKWVINIDETWLNETNHTRRTWGLRDGSGNATLHTVTPRVSMIAAVDNEGNAWFALSHANSDNNMMALFLHSLAEALDQERPGWREDTVI